MKIDWERFISVDPNWVTRLLVEHDLKKESKLTLRVYSLQFSGQKYETISFVSFAVNSIKNYVLSKSDIDILTKNGEEPFLQAMTHFGDVDPTRDGKYGELILYLLTEAVLKVPLIAFKIPTSPNDQIKGGDGVFCGDYNDKPALLIGEAKTWGELNAALKSAFESLDRFYKDYDHSSASYEYFVTKRNLRSDLSSAELDHIYNCFSPGSPEYMERNKVHPILILYDDEALKNIDAQSKNDGETRIKELVKEKIKDYAKNISALCRQYPDVAEVNLDFFLIPLKSVDDLKKALYKKMHGVEWRPKLKKKDFSPRKRGGGSIGKPKTR